MTIFELRYNRKSQEESDLKMNVYSEGHYRTIMLEADDLKQARKLAEPRLEKQFPTPLSLKECEAVVAENPPFSATPEDRKELAQEMFEAQELVLDPASAQSNYKYAGHEVKEMG